MNVFELAEFLAARLESKRLHVCLPLLDWSFSGDNAEQIIPAFEQLEGAQVILVRQFTSIQSSVPFNNDSGGGLASETLGRFFRR